MTVMVSIRLSQQPLKATQPSENYDNRPPESIDLSHEEPHGIRAGDFARVEDVRGDGEASPQGDVC